MSFITEALNMITNSHISMVVIDERSKYEILNALEEIIPSNWNIFGHHMTIKFGGPIPTDLEKYLGKEVKLIATHVGISDMAIAVKVKGFKSYNKNPPYYNRSKSRWWKASYEQ